MARISVPDPSFVHVQQHGVEGERLVGGGGCGATQVASARAAPRRAYAVRRADMARWRGTLSVAANHGRQIHAR